MKNQRLPKVKICCISSKAEADLAIKYGASAIGLVGEMPSGPGVIDDLLIRKISDHIPSDISSFLLTSNIKADKIINHHRMVNTDVIQLVDHLDFEEYQLIKDALPNTKLVQVIHVIDESSIEEAQDVSQYVDAILLDSGNPNLKVKVLGGTGMTHNWELSRKIVESVDIPVYLAGGLNKNNVVKAIEKVKPCGVDLCSGVRTDGKLDEKKLKAFFQAVNSRI